jgi:hypothetical protein
MMIMKLGSKLLVTLVFLGSQHAFCSTAGTIDVKPPLGEDKAGEMKWENYNSTLFITFLENTSSRAVKDIHVYYQFGQGPETFSQGQNLPSTLDAFSSMNLALKPIKFALSSSADIKINAVRWSYDALPVPEPSSYSLVIGGVLAIAILRRKRLTAQV